MRPKNNVVTPPTDRSQSWRSSARPGNALNGGGGRPAGLVDLLARTHRRLSLGLNNFQFWNQRCMAALLVRNFGGSFLHLDEADRRNRMVLGNADAVGVLQ